MADEQLSITVEQLAESVRTAMTREDAEEPLGALAEIIQKNVQEGRVHELVGQILRSLLPAFVMTDADFKTPGSLNQPTKAMHAAREAVVSWFIDLVKSVPQVATPVSVDRTAYRRRMHMANQDSESETLSVKDGSDGGDPSDLSDESSSDENTPPSDSNEQEEGLEKKNLKISKNSKKTAKSAPTSQDCISLDPVLALMERLAVRCPDKAEWRRAVVGETLIAVCRKIPEPIVERYVCQFLLKLVVCEKPAWRVFALEGLASLTGLLGNADVVQTIFQVVLTRTKDASPGVRSTAMKAVASIFAANTGKFLTHISSIIAMFNDRSRDEKPSVRRSAVAVFDQLVSVVGLSLMAESADQICVHAICRLAMDESLMVRKAVIASIVSQPRSVTHSELLWCSAVLPLVTDVESTVIEKVLESFEQCLLGELGVGKKMEENFSLIPVLTLLSAIGSSRDSLEYAKRALGLVVRKGDAKLNKQIGTNLEKLIKSFLNTGDPVTHAPVHVALWALMEELAQSMPPSPSVVAELFQTVLATDLTHKDTILVSLFRVVKLLLEKGGKADPSSFSSALHAFVTTSETSGPKCVGVLHAAVRALHACDLGNKEFLKILEISESHIDNIITNALAGPGPTASLNLDWHIALVGEIASLGFLPSAKCLTALEAIATNRVYGVTAEGESKHASMAPALRAGAMVAFGKICLEKESIAKRAVSKFAAHLSMDEHPIVRNNVLIVLGDLCVVYTGLVDQYLPWVTTCLADPNDLIRFQAAIVVSSLLAEDYIKFKGQIVFRLLFLLSDACGKIRQFVESVFSRILFLRHSGSLKTLFAETVCALNGYSRHPAFQGAVGNRAFFLTANPNRRREIYQFMLTSVVTTEQKFNAIVQLANSLLAAFVDEDVTNGQVQIPERESEPAGQVLVDTLHLLSCQELRLASRSDSLEEAPESAEPGESREKKLFEAALQKKTIVENLVPLLIQLNTLCEQRRSPIGKHVRDCLGELVKDYRMEIGQILHADSQLAQELLYDMGGVVGGVPALADAQPPETALVAPPSVEEVRMDSEKSKKIPQETPQQSPEVKFEAKRSKRVDSSPKSPPKAKPRGAAAPVKEEQPAAERGSSRLARKRKP